ncbi:DUF481 domain-containing protein [Fulvivirga sp.]|uniref:DUF481 domain-containing protein n=1 Tax=Fulvivirga sp. TaxID=1931237 RepID=UPI0032EDBFD3
MMNPVKKLLKQYSFFTLMTYQVKNYILILCSFFLAVGANAQINESDTTKFQLQWLSGGSYQTGNVELLRINNQFDLTFKTTSNLVFKSQNNHLFQEIVSKKADNDLMSKNYLYYQPQRRLYPYAVTFIATNYRRDLDFRVFYGLGTTFQLLQQQRHTVKFSANLLYENSRYANEFFNYSDFNGRNQIKATWSTVYLSGYHYFSESLFRWIYEIYYQQSLKNQINYRFHVLTGMDFKVVKGLSVQSRIIYSLENVVAITNKEEDMLWTWGIVYLIKT